VGVARGLEHGDALAIGCGAPVTETRAASLERRQREPLVIDARRLAKPVASDSASG